MAIIDTLTGYYGFTLDNSSDKSLIDNDGQVNKCFVIITYPIQVNDVDVNISNGDDDWAIKTGDGSIIPCFNPVPLYINRDNTVIELTMKEKYPANSPCSLVYHSDTAKFSIENRTSSREFVPDSATGHIGYTIEGYKGKEITEKDFTGNNDKFVGLVNKVMVSIPFPSRVSNMRVNITDDSSHWGVRMGNGDIIPLENPEIIAVNSDNVVIIFTMHEGYSYPSNSPCILLYRDKNANISLEEIDDDHEFHPVSIIYDLPKEMISGQTIDLSSVKVEPFNATKQFIDWSVVKGPGEIIDKTLIHAINEGEITLRATIENALEGTDDVNDFVHTFTITSHKNEIVILSQPDAEIVDYVGENDHEIAVVAKSTTEEISFQWFKSLRNDTIHGEEIEGATNSKYTIPKNIGRGDFYFYCRITSKGASTIYSNITHIHVSVRCTSISIAPNVKTLKWKESKQLTIHQSPETAELPSVDWFSSDSDIIKVDSNGMITANFVKKKLKNDDLENDGNNFVDEDTITDTIDQVIITAKTTNVLGEQLATSITVTVDTFIPVTDIIMEDIITHDGINIALTSTVIPTDSTNKIVDWSISDDSDNTGCKIANGILTIPKSIIENDHFKKCMIRATIKNGGTEHTDFNKEFPVLITKKFVEVTNVELTNIDTTKLFYVDEILTLSSKTSPITASNTKAEYTILSGPGEITSPNLLSFNGKGIVNILVTIKNGKSIGEDFTKTFSIECSGNESPKDLKNAFIPVTDTIVSFEHLDDDGETINNEYFDPLTDGNNPMELPITVIPSNANHKKYTIEITKIISKIKPDNIISGETNIIEDSFWDETDWEEEDLDLVVYDSTNNTVYCNLEKLRVSRFYIIKFDIKIKSGLKERTFPNNPIEDYKDYKKSMSFKISSETVAPFVPLEDFDIITPSKIRCYYPILITDISYTPDNASIKYDANRLINTFCIPKIQETEDECGVVVYDPKVYDMYHTIPPLEIFDWNLDHNYMYPYNPGVIDITMVINDSTVKDINNFNRFYPEKTFLKKEFSFNVLPPFISVKNIRNIPLSLINNISYVLSPEVSTENGLDCYNPCWDEELPTNTKINWKIISGSDICSIDNQILSIKANKIGNVKLRATIIEGTAEYLEWYGKTQNAVDYVQDFSIDIIDGEDTFDRDICTLTLTDDSIVHIVKYSQMSYLSNDEDENFEITIDGTSFMKSQISKVEFWSSDGDNPNITSLRNFGYNFTNLTSIDRIPETITGDDCLHNFLRGAINFNQDIIIPEGVSGDRSLMYFLRDCTSFNSNITIPTGIKGTHLLHGFLYGCTSFNKPISIPSDITGESAMERFLMHCANFNQKIDIPKNLSGYACLRSFLSYCPSFNQDLVLPDNVGEYKDSNGYNNGRQMNNMMEGSRDMCSNITVPEQTGKFAEISERTFSSYDYQSNCIQTGINIIGDGTENFINKLNNTYEEDENGYKGFPPYVHIRNLD